MLFLLDVSQARVSLTHPVQAGMIAEETVASLIECQAKACKAVMNKPVGTG
jgi:hypothetical protein